MLIPQEQPLFLQEQSRKCLQLRHTTALQVEWAAWLKNQGFQHTSLAFYF